jgi:hypothetical protein
MAHFDLWTSEHPIAAYVAVTALALAIAAIMTGTVKALGLW